MTGSSTWKVQPGGVLRAIGGWLSDKYGAHAVTWWVMWVSWICLFLLSYPQTDFTIATVPARFAELGDLHAEIDDVAHRLDTLIDWADRDDIGTDEDAEIIDMDR